MSLAIPYPTQLDFRAERQVARWRPLVQWLLAIPQLVIGYARDRAGPGGKSPGEGCITWGITCLSCSWGSATSRRR